MTLGCGGFGGNITSDNISPRHLLNIKRVAYELRPASVPRVPTVPEVPKGLVPGASVPAAPEGAGQASTRLDLKRCTDGQDRQVSGDSRSGTNGTFGTHPGTFGTRGTLGTRLNGRKSARKIHLRGRRSSRHSGRGESS